jgi:hypothetical protein
MNSYDEYRHKVNDESGVNKKKFKIIRLWLIIHSFCRYICNHNNYDVFQEIHTQ